MPTRSRNEREAEPRAENSDARAALDDFLDHRLIDVSPVLILLRVNGYRLWGSASVRLTADS